MEKPVRHIALATALASAALAALAVGTADKDIVRGADQFEFVYRVKLPEMLNPAQLWVPLAKSDAFQTVKVEGISSPLQYREVKDREFGNAILVFSPQPADSGRVIEIKYGVRRVEKSVYESQAGEDLRHLQPERLVPVNQSFKAIAEEVASGKTTAMEKGRALYDHVWRRMKYDKTGLGWGRGDALYACDARQGNCTDFHAYFIALARSAGIPARFAIGYTIPAGKDEGEIAAYHCWAEFQAEGKWVPVDISEASRNPALADYYFGHHPANRFEFTRGRDLIVAPVPASSPINFLVYPLLEVEGKVVKTENVFSFKRMKPARSSPNAQN